MQKVKKSTISDKSADIQHITENKLLSIIAHDLRNPFHVITNLSEIILRQAKKRDYEGILKTAKTLHDTSETTYNLLNNLLEWTMIQNKGMRLNLQILNIKELIDHEALLLRDVFRDKNVKIKFKALKRTTIRADEQLIKSVLRNILSNAVKYSYPDGYVVVAIRMNKGTVIVEITDEGMGMTEDEQLLLFNMNANFSKKGTLSETGTGLGLILCKEIIQLHGGTIWVTSSPGKGSTFAFSLPHST